MENTTLKLTPKPKSIEFKYDSEAEAIITLKEGKFYWKGEEIEDKYKVYERFNEWLTKANKENETDTK